MLLLWGMFDIALESSTDTDAYILDLQLKEAST